jgi:hypothetical protein
MKFLSVRGVYDYAGSVAGSRFTPTTMWPSPYAHRVGTPDYLFAAPYPAHFCLYLRFVSRLATDHARLEVKMVRYSFLVRLLHSLLHAGLSRRTGARV